VNEKKEIAALHPGEQTCISEKLELNLDYISDLPYILQSVVGCK
jgi:hypothetical protein